MTMTTTLSAQPPVVLAAPPAPSSPVRGGEPARHFLSHAGVAALLEALVADSGSDVALLDQDGRFLFVSPVVRWWKYPSAKSPVAGKTLHELLPADAAAERLALLLRCAREKRALSLLGMWSGVQVRTTLRPIETPDRGTLVLAVCRPFGSEQETVAGASAAEGGNAGEGGTLVQARWTDRGQLESLTPREIEVLTLIGQGLTTADIAKTLYRSHKTVEAHRLSLGLKLKAKNRVELARIAFRAGLTQHRPTKPTIAARLAAMRSAPGDAAA